MHEVPFQEWQEWGPCPSMTCFYDGEVPLPQQTRKRECSGVGKCPDKIENSNLYEEIRDCPIPSCPGM